MRHGDAGVGRRGDARRDAGHYLEGDAVAAEFLDLIEQYVETHYPARIRENKP